MNQKENKKQFICEKKNCGKKFNYESHYIRHIKVHDNEKKFKCKQCEKSFKREDALTVHERSHKNELIYACEQQGCDQKFSNKASLRYHTLKHKNEEVFICEIDNCNKKFLTIAQLNQHLRTKAHNNGSNLNSKKSKKQSLILDELNIEKKIKTQKLQESNSEILYGRDIFQFEEQQQKLIDDVYYKKQNFSTLVAQIPETQYGILKQEMLTVVGLADKISYHEPTNKEIIKTALSYVQTNKFVMDNDNNEYNQNNIEYDNNDYNFNNFDYYNNDNYCMDIQNNNFSYLNNDNILAPQTQNTYNNNNNNNNFMMNTEQGEQQILINEDNDQFKQQINKDIINSINSSNNNNIFDNNTNDFEIKSQKSSFFEKSNTNSMQIFQSKTNESFEDFLQLANNNNKNKEFSLDSSFQQQDQESSVNLNSQKIDINQNNQNLVDFF